MRFFCWGRSAVAPKEGTDAFYAVVGGVEGQKGVVAVAPGDPDYHGGHWKVHVVMWHVEVEPYLLTSEVAVLMA